MTGDVEVGDHGVLGAQHHRPVGVGQHRAERMVAGFAGQPGLLDRQVQTRVGAHSGSPARAPGSGGPWRAACGVARPDVGLEHQRCPARTATTSLAALTTPSLVPLALDGGEHRVVRESGFADHADSFGDGIPVAGHSPEGATEKATSMAPDLSEQARPGGRQTGAMANERRRVLVTGAAGYIAGQLLPAFREKYDLTLIDVVPTHRRAGHEVDGVELLDLLDDPADRFAGAVRARSTPWCTAGCVRRPGPQLRGRAGQPGHDRPRLRGGRGGRRAAGRRHQHQPGREMVRAVVEGGSRRPGGPGGLPAAGQLLRLGQGRLRDRSASSTPAAAPDRRWRSSRSGSSRPGRSGRRPSPTVRRRLPARHHRLDQRARPAAALRPLDRGGLDRRRRRRPVPDLLRRLRQRPDLLVDRQRAPR